MIRVERRDGFLVVLVDGVERITYVGEAGDEAFWALVREILGDDGVAAIESTLKSDLT